MEPKEFKFTWFPKLTHTVECVPEEQRGLLLWALAQYGTYRTEPDLEYPLNMAFEALREDIDNSRRNRNQNSGGRPPKKTAEDDVETEVHAEETEVLETETKVSNQQNLGLDDAEPNPYHTKPIHTMPSHTKPNQKRGRFTPPTVDEVRAYCGEKGYTFDPETFCAFYESKGWRVGNSPMKSWRAACVSWQNRRKDEKGAAHDEYSNL